MKAIFLDRDGTINVDHGFVHRPEDFILIPGVTQGLKKMQELGLGLFVVTNQSGIGRGYYTLEQFKKVSEHFLGELSKHGVSIEKIYYCAHSPEEGCDCRKPNIKMVLDAKDDYDIDLKKSYFIGDKEADVLTGKKAGCKTILVLTGKTKKESECRTKPDFVAEDLVEAARIIEDYQE